jgi:amino acid adenylation domain-containing protein
MAFHNSKSEPQQFPLARQASPANEQLSRDGGAGEMLRDCDAPLPWGHAVPEAILLSGETASAGEEPTSPPDPTLRCRLSPAQKRLWFLEKLHPAMRACNEAHGVRIKGPLDAGCLESALNVLVARHEALRTLIQVIDGCPRQVVQPSGQLEVTTIDLTDLGPNEREPELKRLLVEEPRRPFNLAAAPGIRAALVRLVPDEHVLILTIHHGFCDTWSFAILCRELEEVYGALSRGRAPDLPPQKLHLGDFAAWKCRQVDSGMQEQHLAFWSKYMEGAPTSLALPTQSPRPEVFSYEGEKRSYPLGEAVTERIRSFSQREGVSVFTVLTTAFNVLLGRYTDQEEIVIGIPVDNRDQQELTSVFGLLADFHGLRTDLSGNPTCRELLRRVHTGILDVKVHGAIPFDNVLEAVQPRRELARAPLFQARVVWEDRRTQLHLKQLEGLRLSYEPAHPRTSTYDLTLYVADVGEDLCLKVEYCTDLFSTKMIDQFAEELKTLLAGIAEHPEERLAGLPILTSDERRQLLVEWNSTQAEYPRETCLQELFERQVELTPDRPAVVCKDRQLTYRELNRQADRVAHHLRNLGVGPDVLVALCAERSLNTVVALLGILKAGGAYLPLDPTYPADRLAFMLDDARPLVLLTQQKLEPSLPPHSARVVSLDSFNAEIGSGQSNLAERNGRATAGRSQSSASLAYVIYTSGSTGKPKGVQISHRALVNLLISMRRQPGLEAEDILLSVTTLAFDIAALEFFLPLVTGARLIIAAPEVLNDGRRLAQLLEDCGATVMQATPATWRMLLHAGWEGSKRLNILCGGEALAPDLADQLLVRCRALWNLYGPTETTVWSTACRVLPGRPITIGRPIANTQVYLLDRHFQPVPAGVTGELCIGGDGLARGYLNRPELNEAKFIADSFSSDPGARLYRTGDLARYRHDGQIEFLGRSDHQVKVRGFRIEPGEVEAVLGKHPQVREGVVVAREDTPGETQLTAYVVPRGRLTPPPSQLRSFLQQKLPAYMIPSAFVMLKALPLTANGKIDRRALPSPGTGDLETPKDSAVPRDPVEEKLAAIWTAVLGLKQVGIHDDFFDLGGHSLMAVRLFDRIEKTFGIDLPLGTLFEATTISRLAKVLQKSAQSRLGMEFVSIQPHGSKPPVIFLPSLGGEILYCRPIARYLDPDQPIYGIQPGRSNGCGPQFTPLEEIAARFVEGVRTFLPEGPYHLVGYSFGGKLAYEMARQLSVLGRPVSTLAIIDAELSQPLDRSVTTILRLALAFFRNLPYWVMDDLLRVHPKKMLARIWRHVRKLRRGHGSMAGPSEGRPVGPELQDLFDISQLPDHYRDLMAANLRAYLEYVPKSYPGRVTLFRARTRPLFHSEHYDLGWGRWALGGVEIKAVPGHHQSILIEPAVATLGRLLKTGLDQAG